MKFNELYNKVIEEDVDKQDFGIGEKPEKIKGEWNKIREKYDEDRYHKTPMWYIVQYALNDYESNRYYNNMNDAWVGECGGGYDYASNDLDGDPHGNTLEKIREISQKPVPKWFKDLYWYKIDNRIQDKHGIFDFDINNPQFT